MPLDQPYRGGQISGGYRVIGLLLRRLIGLRRFKPRRTFDKSWSYG